MDKYEEMLKEKLNQVKGFQYEDMEKLDRYSAKTAEQVLQILLSRACQAQNEANITLGRKKILEIPEGWLRLHIMETAKKCLDLSDEWEYRRFMELIVLALPDLEASVLELGEKSENSEIREAARDFLEERKKTKAPKNGRNSKIC